EGDICSATSMHEVVEGIDYVLHQAAVPSVPRSVRDPITTNLVNVHGTLQVLVAARDAKVKRVVHASSSSVYGNTPTMPKVETMRPIPLSPYACSKLAGEQYGCAFFGTYGLEYVALRYFNVFGPRQDPQSQYSAAIPKFITAYMQKTAPTVFGDGSQSRDFCFIDNVVEANLLACKAEGAAGKVFNIACGERTELLEVLRLLEERFGRHVEPHFEPHRAGDVKHSLADISRAKNILGYQPVVYFKEGLARTTAFFERTETH
ncbi:MAG: NAD-dependent epimerase/dehydratase family protein, partial [Deltaproteobacteria bacterium]|nr:NAD-dependent epimerase/dehydratase family protein [Deltaproteobacteria bacterium]